MRDGRRTGHGGDVKVDHAATRIGDEPQVHFALRRRDGEAFLVRPNGLRESRSPAWQVLRLGKKRERVLGSSFDGDALRVVAHGPPPSSLWSRADRLV